MKRISFLILFAALAATPVFGQDTATQQQIDKLAGQIQDLNATLGKQDQAIAELRRDISELRDKVNTPPPVNDSASRDDLKKLAKQVQEIDEKRVADRELITKEIEKLGKAAVAAAAVPTHISTKPSTPKPAADDTDTAAPATPQNGYEYVVQKGDSLSAIAKAYRAKGVKVTTAQIIKANPGLSAATLYSGRKIFIPDANAK
jgi:LysM repeat protein